MDIESGMWPGVHIVNYFLGQEPLFDQGREDVVAEAGGEFFGVDFKWDKGDIRQQSSG